MRLTDEIKRIYDASYGPDDPDQAELLLLRARILRQAGANVDAVTHCRDALALQRRISVATNVLRETNGFCEELERERRA